MNKKLEDYLECSTRFRSPPSGKNPQGEPRKVGVEIEFAGLTTSEAAEVFLSVAGGKIVNKSEHLIFVEGSEIGNARFELDAQYVHPDSPEESDLLQKNRVELGKILRPLVPQEMVTDPVEFELLPKVDEVADRLAAAGATGTDESLLHAFGLHLNPEIASEEVGYLLSVIRSMILLDKPVRNRMKTDFSRDVLRWAQSYTPKYKKTVMNPSYEPDLHKLIEDYIAANKGRNHHLDMLPVFRHLDNDFVTGLLGTEYSGSRPAFHFRLPDSRLDEEDWSVRKNWNLWVGIEELANDLAKNGVQNWQGDVKT